MRKNIILLFTIVSLSSFLPSCEKVINLKLNSSSSVIVIQGNVYDQAGPYTVKITKSVSLDESSVYPAVTGALVIIADNAGNSDTLSETSSGVYVTSTLQGVAGRTYTLTVLTDSVTYSASSTMPNAVKIDSIYLKNSTFGNDKEIAIDFTDPADTDNYYHLVEFINSTQQTDFNVTDDELYQGKVITYTFSQSNDTKLNSGDAITIWLESIDKGVYDYYRTAGSEDGESASPANPTSNINNGALGYFNASSVRKISFVVPSTN
jgi:hypothetical protein